MPRTHMHRCHPMRSDITKRIAIIGQHAAPEGPGPRIVFKTDSLRFQDQKLQLPKISRLTLFSSRLRHVIAGIHKVVPRKMA